MQKRKDGAAHKGWKGSARGSIERQKLIEALRPFARYYEMNDCHERRPDDALEVPISDLKRAYLVMRGHREPSSYAQTPETK